MERSAFEALVHQAVRELPAEFRDKLENVAVIVEDEPSAELLERMGIPPEDTLLGLYEGVPLTERAGGPPLYPDTIWIFQRPIEEECENEAEILDEVKITLLHEVAHFFGLDDEYLEDLGY